MQVRRSATPLAGLGRRLASLLHASDGFVGIFGAAIGNVGRTPVCILQQLPVNALALQEVLVVDAIRVDHLDEDLAGSSATRSLASIEMFSSRVTPFCSL